MDTARYIEEKDYNISDIYALPDGKRAEIIDGRWYDMAPPSPNHQKLVSFLNWKLKNYIENKGGDCEVFPAPFAVFLNADDKNYVEPDISVICDPDRINDKGLNGAPDMVIEIVSPSSKRMDYYVKLFKYRTAGVREYWVVNPMTRVTNVFFFDDEEEKADGDQVSFEDELFSHIYPDFSVRIADDF